MTLPDGSPDPFESGARQAIAHWELDGPQLTYLSERENVVYRVDTADGRTFALRIHRPGYHTLAALVSEHQWVSALSADGIAVPRPVSTAAGEPYVEVQFDGGPRFVGLIEWCEGRPLWQVLDDEGHDPLPTFRALGALTARLHRHSEGWMVPDGFMRHRLDVAGLLGDAPWWGPFWDLPELTTTERNRIEQARPVIAEALGRLGTDPDRFGVIHADLLPQNLLVHDGVISAIDFDDAGFGWYLYDLAVALSHHLDRPGFGDLRDALVDGYRTVRPLADDDAHRITMFLLIRKFATIGWYHSRVASHVVSSTGAHLRRADLVRPEIDWAMRLCDEVLPELR